MYSASYNTRTVHPQRAVSEEPQVNHLALQTLCHPVSSRSVLLQRLPLPNPISHPSSSFSHASTGLNIFSLTGPLSGRVIPVPLTCTKLPGIGVEILGFTFEELVRWIDSGVDARDFAENRERLEDDDVVRGGTDGGAGAGVGVSDEEVAA
jgi:hypothetical protein